MIQDQFVQQLLQSFQDVSVIAADENRPWGAWWLYQEGVDPHTAEIFDKKIIRVNPSSDLQMLSLQFHGLQDLPGHREIWKAHSDIVVMIGQKDMVGLSQQEIMEEVEMLRLLKLSAGETLEIPSGYLHALVNPWQHQSIYVEEIRLSPANSGQSYLQREENITRIFDQTGRGGLPDFPIQLKQKVRNLR